MEVLILLVGIIPHEIVPVDRCETIEVNHYYDGEGKLIFVQAIFWSSNDVVDWRMIKHKELFPFRRSGRWTMIWTDNRMPRQVIGKTVKMTWTQYDPELRHRTVLPKEQRRELTRPRR